MNQTAILAAIRRHQIAGSYNGWPTFAVVTLPDQTQIAAAIARTAAQRMRGLMGKRHLPGDRGMLLVHPYERDGLTVWMLNMLVPLDLVWINSVGCVVAIEPQAPPCTVQPCVPYGRHAPAALFVLELAAGRAAQSQLRIGDLLAF
jgi:uncharacterized protein